MPLSDPAATTFNYPALTIEATQNKLIKVRWINELFDPQTGNYLPHLLPVDRTLHWANPEMLACKDGTTRTDCRPAASNGSLLLQPYEGPVPIVTHVHGAHVNPESDGYPEAWWLPAANNIPAGYATEGGLFDQWDPTNNWPGSALYGYYNTQRASTIWYHDHGLGITRLNVYAGPAGFWLIRGARGSEPDLISGRLPGPAPAPGEDPNFNLSVRNKIREIPIVIQGRTFKPDGELFFPDNRAYFEGLNVVDGTSPTLDIPFYPEETVDGVSDLSPIWNPEFFGNAMVINGTTWPVYNVAPSKYRLRLLNGCNARFLILKMVSDPLAERPASPALSFYQIGSDGGLLPEVVEQGQLLLGPAERFDVIVDFSDLSDGSEIYMINEGPDEPFGGGVVGTDFDPSDPQTTGQIMKFVIDASLLNATGSSDSYASAPESLVFKPREELIPDAPSRMVSLNEEESETVIVSEDEDGIYYDPEYGEAFGPLAAKVGTVAIDPATGGYVGVPLSWTDMSGASTDFMFRNERFKKPVTVPVTEMPFLNDTEEWEIFNFTMDAHPIHLHLVEFQVVDREGLTPSDPDGRASFLDGKVREPEAWENGWKDTVIAYPGEVTRIKARFDVAGIYVWHCHIIDHEDNEMMRPYAVVPDLDKNSCVDRKDLAILLKDMFRGRTYDINGDGAVNLLDALRLTQYFTNPLGRPCR